MTLNEFRAWLEGYSAAFKDGVPSAEQWAEVNRRLLLVQQAPANVLTTPGLPITEPARPYWSHPSTGDWTPQLGTVICYTHGAMQ